MTPEELAKRDFRCMTFSVLAHIVLERIDPNDPVMIARKPELDAIKNRTRASFATLKMLQPQKVDMLAADVKEFVDHELPVMLVEELSTFLNEMEIA